jgi:hypothetical protein
MTSKPETRAAILSGNTFMEAVVKPIARQHESVLAQREAHRLRMARFQTHELRLPEDEEEADA